MKHDQDYSIYSLFSNICIMRIIQTEVKLIPIRELKCGGLKVIITT